MSYGDYRDRIERLKNLINRECTGSPEMLANTLGVSRRTLFKDLDMLRDDGLKITYNRYRETYFYEQ